MPYSLEIKFTPANELFISMYAFLCKKICKRLELGSEWAEETKSNLPAAFQKKLEQVDLQELWHPICILMLQSPDHRTPAAFLRWFQDVSIGEVYERLVPYVSTFSANLNEVRHQMLELLAEWDEHYFRHINPQIVKSLEEDQKSWAKIRYENVIEFTGEVTNGCQFEEKEGLQKVVLIPQYHYSPYNHIKHFGSSTLCMYAVNDLPHRDDDEPTVPVNRFIRSIGDRNRLKIMRHLQEKPRTLLELSSYLGLAKSTVHDHLTSLRTAGIAMNHVVGEAATHYSFREESYRSLNEQLNEYLHLRQSP